MMKVLEVSGRHGHTAMRMDLIPLRFILENESHSTFYVFTTVKINRRRPGMGAHTQSQHFGSRV